MWSLGVILYRLMYAGRYPFLDPNIKYDVPNALRDILKNELVIPSHPKRSLSL